MYFQLIFSYIDLFSYSCKSFLNFLNFYRLSHTRSSACILLIHSTGLSCSYKKKYNIFYKKKEHVLLFFIMLMAIDPRRFTSFILSVFSQNRRYFIHPPRQKRRPICYCIRSRISLLSVCVSVSLCLCVHVGVNVSELYEAVTVSGKEKCRWYTNTHTELITHIYHSQKTPKQRLTYTESHREVNRETHT